MAQGEPPAGKNESDDIAKCAQCAGAKVFHAGDGCAAHRLFAKRQKGKLANHVIGQFGGTMDHGLPTLLLARPPGSRRICPPGAGSGGRFLQM